MCVCPAGDKKDDVKKSSDEPSSWINAVSAQSAPGVFPMDFAGGLMGFNSSFAGR